MFNLVVNFGVHILPISLALFQIIETIIVYWSTDSMLELKEEWADYGLQLGIILSAMINFRPNANKLPTFGTSEFEKTYHDGF